MNSVGVGLLASVVVNLGIFSLLRLTYFYLCLYLRIVKHYFKLNKSSF